MRSRSCEWQRRGRKLKKGSSPCTNCIYWPIDFCNSAVFDKQINVEIIIALLFVIQFQSELIFVYQTCY